MQADGQSWRNIQLDLRRAQPAPRRPTQGRPGLGHPGAGNPGLGHLGTHHLAPTGHTAWTTADIEARLAAFGFDDATPLTALAIELLPEPNGAFDAPLAGDLGQVRILRTSPLVAVGGACCPPDI
jgi:hypothetical protein